MKKAVTLAALLGATGLSFAYFQLRAKEKEDSSVDIAPTKREVAPGIFLVNGVYSLDAETSVEGAQGTAFQLGLLGKLRVHSLGRVGEVWVERWEFSGQATSSTLDEKQLELFSEAMARPFFVERSGALVRGLRFEGDTVRPAQTTWRSLVTLAQFQSSTEALWQVSEEDATGTYLAQYEKKGEHTEKTKLRYTSSRSPELAVRILTSEETFTLKGERRTLSASEDIETSSRMLPVPLRGLLRLDLDYREATEAPEKDWYSDYESAETLSLEAAGTETSIAGELDRARVKGFTWETAAASLHGDPKEKGYARAYQALVSLLRLDPKALESALKAAETDGPLKTAVLAALGDAGTPEAQAALRNLLKRGNFPDDLRLLMARGLSRTNAPTKDTVDFLRANVGDPAIGQQARLGLGSNIARLAASNPELGKEAMNAIESGLKSAPESERGDYLGALGNTRQESALPIVRPYLTDKNESLAARATLALRHLPGATTDVLLSEQMAAGRPAEVRISALRALRDREPRSPLIEQVATLMVNEPEARVRGAAIELGAFWAETTTYLREILAQVASKETDENLKNIAVATLARLGQ